MDSRLKILNQALVEHASHKDFLHAQKIVDAVLGLFQVQVGEHDWNKPFTDSAGKLRANAGWFMSAPGYADRRATYVLAGKNKVNIDFKAYWLKKKTKSIISWLVALTPNFEDRPYYKKENLGVDFVISKEADKVLVVLSNNFSLRTLELSDKLSLTDLEIFGKWIQPFDHANKEQVHTTLWDSFDFEPVNKLFYKKISELFIELKQHLVNENIFDDKHANYFSNRLIGRLIFCWFLDKKEIINPKIEYFDTEGQDSTSYYHTKLEPLFFHTLNTPIQMRSDSKRESQTDLFPNDQPKDLFNYKIDLVTPFLNGGLFEPRANDLKGDSKLTFPADYFDRVYEHLNHYHFTTDESTSDYQQVAIDPEMLGRIFENLLAEQSEETGEQARKAKGAFYTPREIVDYMCRESLREYLKSQLPDSEDIDQRIAELLDIKTHEFRDQQRNYHANLKPYKSDLMKALDSLKVLDPACGSGAFPMGMQQLLLNVYERLETRLDPYRTKIDILKNNIFGVDIEPMAVEISRLRAWLSIIVDQDPKTKIEALPNLDFKFVCANSLLPLAANGQLSFADHQELEEKQKAIRDAYFNTTDHDGKLKLKNEYTDLIKDKVIDSFPESERITQLRSYNPFDSENITAFFDPEFMFGFPKFDVVIGNPPYVNVFKLSKIKKDKTIYKKNYLSARGAFDLYILFIELGVKLAAKNGITSFITPNKYLAAKYAEELRKFLFKEKKLVSFVDLSHLSVFNAGVYPVISTYKNNNKSSEIDIVSAKKVDTYQFTKTSKLDVNSLSTTSECNFGLLLHPKSKLIYEKLNKLRKLDEISTITASFSVSDAYKSRQYINNFELVNNIKDWKKFIISSNIFKYYTNWGTKPIDYLKSRYIKPLMKTDLKIISENRVRQILQPKIVIAGMTKTIRAFYDVSNDYISGIPTILLTDMKENPYLILGLINSKLLSYYFHMMYDSLSLAGGYLRIGSPQISSLPIPPEKMLSSEIKNEMAELVQNMIGIVSSDFSAVTEPYLNQSEKIDQLVYQLYDLTPEEIEIVEKVNR